MLSIHKKKFMFHAMRVQRRESLETAAQKDMYTKIHFVVDTAGYTNFFSSWKKNG